MPQYLQPSLKGFGQAKTAIQVLTKEESRRYLEYARDKDFRDFVMVEFALFTGLRCAELIGLDIEHVEVYDQVPRYLSLPGSIAKAGKSRQIPIHAQLREDLEAYLGWRAKLAWPSHRQCPLFISKKTGRRLSTRDFQRITRNIGVAALGHAVNPHMLRHTFATMLLENTNLRVVQMALGHESLQSTQIYVHPNSDDMSRAVDALPTAATPSAESGGRPC